MSSKEHSWNKLVLWQIICHLSGKSLSTTTSSKDSTGNFRRDQNEILSPWREYLEDLLNPIKATPTDTCNTIDLGKKVVFTLTEVAATIQGLKSMAPGEDKIRPEILKALNKERVCWLIG